MDQKKKKKTFICVKVHINVCLCVCSTGTSSSSLSTRKKNHVYHSFFLRNTKFCFELVKNFLRFNEPVWKDSSNKYNFKENKVLGFITLHRKALENTEKLIRVLKFAIFFFFGNIKRYSSSSIWTMMRIYIDTQKKYDIFI